MLSRKAKLRENAAKHMEPGEEIRESVLVRMGAVRQQNHALIATDRNLYAFRLSWPGFSKVAEQLARIPLAEARLEVTGNAVVLLDPSSGEERRRWKRLPFRNPTGVAEHVNAQAG